MKNIAENTHKNTAMWLPQYLGFCLLLIHFACQNSDKDAWTTYRNDNARSGITSTKLNFPLTQNWAHMPSHAPVTSWHEPAGELPRMHSDNVYHVTTANGMAYFGSPTDNKVYAIDIATGTTRWTFYTEGPVRFAPTILEGQIYVGSDDGYVYCLKARSGKLLWKYRPGPSDEKILGMARMISLWPVRTSILLDDGIAYFAAGIFPYEGLYICALNADDGSVVWSNNSIGDRAHELQYGGFSPQSYLVASKDVLYVPSGRALPAAFNKNTGEFLFYTNPGDPGKGGGTWTLLDGDNLVAGVDFYGTPAKLSFDGKTGEKIEDVHGWFPGIDMVTTNDISYILTENGIAAIERQKYTGTIEAQKKLEKEEGKLSGALRGLMRQKYYSKESNHDKSGNDLDEQIDDLLEKIKQKSIEIEQLKTSLFKWNYVKKNLKSLILTGNAMIAGGDDTVVALDIESGKEIWQHEIEGAAYGLAATKGSLIVSTDKGQIYNFSEKEVEKAKIVKSELNPGPYARDKLTPIYESAAEKILKETGVNKGYCLVLNSGTGRLAYELAKRSELKIIGIEDDKEKVKTAKTNLDKAGLYGSRVVVEQWELSSLPDYFANLIVSDEMLINGKISGESQEIYRILKPYGGTAYFGQVAEPSTTQSLDLQHLKQWLQNPDAEEPTLDHEGGQWAKIIRGKLEGAGSWSQQYANPQNTANSGDKLVSGQLGVLWFGEPGPKGIVERHSRAASPVSVDGRLFVQGEEIIMAYDAYNGSLLWEKKIPGAVRAMADVDCGNLVLCENGLFVAAYDKCYHLNPTTGETIRVFNVPPSADGSPRRWGYISYNKGILYGSATTPLISSYAAVYNNLVEDGKWKNTNNLPPQYQSELERLKSKYPVPNEALHRDLHRSGALFRTMANWPRGGEHSIKGAVTDNNQSSSDKVFAFDAETGKLLWKHDGSKISNITIALGNGKIYFAESKISSAQKQTAIRERHKFTKLGVYKVREGILKDLKEAETEVAHLMENENPDPRYVDKMAYRVNTIKAEMYREENEKGILEYKDADLRIVYALDAVSGKKIWAKPVDLTGCCGDRMGTIFYDNMLFFAGNFGNHDAWRFWHGSYKWRRVMALSAENGEIQWSRALNYRTRPLFLGDKLIIEPRACDPRTGEIIMRTHPVTGQNVPWEFLRPGHTCAETSASADGLFYRSACTAFYDVTQDRGVTYFGGLREGCLINMIPASGLVMIPEASSGCVCAYPIRTTVVLKRKEKRPEPWTVFITHGPMTPVKRFAINLGAPSDYKDNAGNLWFAYPNPNTHYNNHFNNYGVKFNLQDKYQQDMGYFCNDFKSMEIQGTDNPWLFSSGCLGFSKCEIPLIDDIFGEEEGSYTLRLGFKPLEEDRIGNRIFDIKIQGEVAIKNFDLAKEAGTIENIIIKTLKGIPVKNALHLELLSKKDNPSEDETPLINFIEIIREDEIKVATLAKDESGISDIVAAKLLEKAAIDFEQNQYESALQNYHLVLDMSSSNVQKQRALEGMALIASPKSLSRLRNYCRDVTPMPKGFKEYTRHLDLISFGKYKALDPNRLSTPKNKVESIVWDYNEPEPELIDGAIKVFVAIAHKIAENDREKAIRMLNYTLDYANEDLRNEVVDSLKNLGANI